MDIYIYTLSDPNNNNVRYVGKTNKLKKRFSNHLNTNHSKSHKNNWIKSLKTQGLIPIMDIIDIVSIETWKFWEIHYISLYKSWGFDLTNHTNGGDDNPMNYEEIRDKLKGEKNPMFGKTHTKEVKDKISLANKIRVHSEESGKKKSLALKGIVRSQETKDKISKNNGMKNPAVIKLFMGENNPFYGKEHSEETKKKLAETNSIKVIQIDKDTNEIIKIWDSMKDASEFLSGKRYSTSISNVCRGICKTSMGYVWKYLN